MKLPMTALVLAGALWSAAAGAQEISFCGELANAFGPFDYRTAPQDTRNIVERHHFDGNVATLRHGITGSIGGDISYTLRAFPNHPRALQSMADLALKEKRTTPTGSAYSIDCWFDRAIRFKPDDGMVRIVHGIALIKSGRKNEGLKELETALDLIGDDPNAHYNLGLVYFDLGRYDQSLEHAKKAYEMGFNLPGLRNKLEKAGKWK